MSAARRRAPKRARSAELAPRSRARRAGGREAPAAPRGNKRQADSRAAGDARVDRASHGGDRGRRELVDGGAGRPGGDIGGAPRGDRTGAVLVETDWRRLPRITRGDRVLIVGATQSGKSTLAYLLGLSWSRFIGQDPKAAAHFVPPDTVIARSGDAAAAAYPVPGRVMYHPPVMKEKETRADFDIAMRRIYAVRGGGVLIHELASLTDPDNCEAGLNRVLYEGAEIEVPMIYCTQEPVRIYTKFFSQATIVIVFYLVPEHRAYLARMCGAPAINEPIPLDHTYGVWHRKRPEEFIRMPALPLGRKAS